MGLTIHYKLQADLSDTKSLRRKVEQLRSRALDLPFAAVLKDSSSVSDLQAPIFEFSNFEHLEAQGRKPGKKK